jgi:DNA polymerase III delta subunit
VASYTQWRAAIDAGELRRVTWVCGDQHVLVEEIVDTIKSTVKPGDLDYVSICGGTDFDARVWAAANQYSLSPGNNRLILVRDAEKLNDRGQLGTWLSRTRQLPGVYLVFVSNEVDLPYTSVMGRKILKPHAALIKAPRGYLVRATMPAEADAVAWVRRRANLDEDSARYLLTRSGGNLATAAAVTAKLSLFDGRASTSTIDLLCLERPMDDFTDILLALDKRRALLRIPDLDEPERFKLTGLLDSRLDLLEQLHRHQIAGHGFREISSISPFLVRQYMPIARHYDPARCVHRRRVLAVVDDALRSGARVGVIEALVALW